MAPRPRQHLLSSVRDVLAVLAGVPWDLTTVPRPIALVTNDTEHLVKRFLAIQIISLETCLFRPSAHFFN